MGYSKIMKKIKFLSTVISKTIMYTKFNFSQCHLFVNHISNAYYIYSYMPITTDYAISYYQTMRFVYRMSVYDYPVDTA